MKLEAPHLMTSYCVRSLNILYRAQPASLCNDHLSPNVMESLPQFRSLKFHLDSIFLFQIFAAVVITVAAAIARESSC